MTSDVYSLEASDVLSKNPLPLYRLAKTKYANLSGVGSSIYPGRWNRPGQEAIYTSTEMGVPVLERLVHTPKSAMPINLSMMHLGLQGNWTSSVSEHGEIMIDRSTGGIIRLFNTLRMAFAAFDQIALIEQQPFAIAMPSVIVPVWNVVLYPSGRAFWSHVRLLSLVPFSFDPRLFPEGISYEAESSK